MAKHTSWIPITLLFLLWGCGGAQPDLKAKEYKGRFEDKAQGVSFTCPEKWEVRENIHGQRVIARSPLESRQDSFQENLVVTGPLPGKSQQEVRDQVVQDLKSQLTKFAEEKSDNDSLDYVHELDGQSLKCRSYVLPGAKDGEFWLYTLNSTAKEFVRWEKPFAEISSTFHKPIVEFSPTPSQSATPATTATPEASVTPAATATPGVTTTPVPEKTKAP